MKGFPRKYPCDKSAPYSTFGTFASCNTRMPRLSITVFRPWTLRLTLLFSFPLAGDGSEKSSCSCFCSLSSFAFSRWKSNIAALCSSRGLIEYEKCLLNATARNIRNRKIGQNSVARACCTCVEVLVMAIASSRNKYPRSKAAYLVAKLVRKQ